MSRVRRLHSGGLLPGGWLRATRCAAITVAIAVVAGCDAPPASPASSAAAPAASGGPSTDPGLSPAPAASGSAVELPDDLPVGPGDYVLPDPANGLASLQSHRSTLAEAFEGTASGTAINWSRNVTYASSSSLAARLRTVAWTGADPSAGAAAAPEPATAVEIGGAIFELDSDGNCATSDAAGAVGSVADPVTELGALIGAAAAGPEAIGSIETTVYLLDAPTLGIYADVQASGKVWIATAGEYIVRSELSVTGGADYFGEGITGTLTTRYDVVETNAAVTIDVPAACRAVTFGLEPPADATDVVDAPGFLAYATQASVKKAVAAIKAAATAAGWKAPGIEVIDEETAHLEFTVDGHRVDAFVTTEDGARYVQVVAAAGGE